MDDAARGVFGAFGDGEGVEAHPVLRQAQDQPETADGSVSFAPLLATPRLLGGGYRVLRRHCLYFERVSISLTRRAGNSDSSSGDKSAFAKLHNSHAKTQFSKESGPSLESGM